MYIAVILNLVVENQIIRTVIITPDADNLLLYGRMQNAVSALAAIIADSLLVSFHDLLYQKMRMLFIYLVIAVLEVLHNLEEKQMDSCYEHSNNIHGHQ